MAKTLPNGQIQVEAGDTLSGIYGANWKQASGYTGDPTKLQVGTVLPAKQGATPTPTPTSTPTPQPTTPQPSSYYQAGPTGQSQQQIDNLALMNKYTKENGGYTISPEGAILPKSSIIPSSGSGVVTSTDDKNAQIQAIKDQIAKTQAELIKKQQEELVSKTTEAQTSTAQAIIDKLKKDAGTLPNPYSAEDTLKTLQSEQGTTAIQEHINTINDELNKAEAGKKADMYKVGDELESMEFITDKQTKIGRMWDEKITALQNNKKALVDEYNLKVSNINAIMAAKKEDYTTAKAAYDDKFSQAIQMMTLTNTMENTATDNARANWTAMMGLLKGMDTSTMSDDMKASLDTLDAQMGNPKGYSNYVLENTPPDEDILFTVQNKDDDGNVISNTQTYKDAQGNIKSRVITNIGYSATGDSNTTTTDDTYDTMLNNAFDDQINPATDALTAANNVIRMLEYTPTEKERKNIIASAKRLWKERNTPVDLGGAYIDGVTLYSKDGGIIKTFDSQSTANKFSKDYGVTVKNAPSNATKTQSNFKEPDKSINDTISEMKSANPKISRDSLESQLLKKGYSLDLIIENLPFWDSPLSKLVKSIFK